MPDARRPGALRSGRRKKFDAYDRSTANLPPPHAARPLAFPGFSEAMAFAHDHVVRGADHQPCVAADRGAVAARHTDADGYSRGAGNLAVRFVQPPCGRAARPRAQAAGRDRGRRRTRRGIDCDSPSGMVRRDVGRALVRRRLSVRSAKRGRRRRVSGPARTDGRAQAARRSQRQDLARRDFGRVDRSGHGRRPHPGADCAVRDRTRRRHVLRFGAHAAPA